MRKKILIYISTVLAWLIILYLAIKVIDIFEYNLKMTFDITYSKYAIGIEVLLFIFVGLTIAIIDIISLNNSLKENLFQFLILGLAGLYLSMSQIVMFTFVSVRNIIYPTWIIYSRFPMIFGSVIFGWQLMILIKSIVKKINRKQ